jgi:hypothetical protein
MSTTIYTGENFRGDSHTLNNGVYTASYFRDIDYARFDHPESISVDRNTIVHLSTSSHPTGFGDNRIIIGPQRISSLKDLGFVGQVSSIKVLRFRQNNWGSPARVVVYNNYNMQGFSKVLREGEYSSERIASRENNETGIRDGDIRSLIVDHGTVAILYDGENFEEHMNTIFVQGPANITSLEKYGMDGKLSSIKVFSIDEPPRNLPPNQQKNFLPSFLGLNRIAEFGGPGRIGSRKPKWTKFARSGDGNDGGESSGGGSGGANVFRARVHSNKMNYFMWVLIIILIFVLVAHGKKIYTMVYDMFHDKGEAIKVE